MKYIVVLLLSFFLALPACAETLFTPPVKPVILRIDFRTGVTKESIDQLEAAFRAGEEKKVTAVLITLDSAGGCVDNGWRAIRLIQSSPVPVHCLVDGEADSMAFFMLQACTTRGMTAVSKVMSHQPYFKMTQDTPLRLSELRSLLNNIQTMIDQVEILSAARMGMTLAEFRRQNEVDWWMSSIAARKVNAVDYVVNSVEAVRKSLESTGKLP